MAMVVKTVLRREKVDQVDLPGRCGRWISRPIDREVYSRQGKNMAIHTAAPFPSARSPLSFIKPTTDLSHARATTAVRPIPPTIIINIIQLANPKEVSERWADGMNGQR